MAIIVKKILLVEDDQARWKVEVAAGGVMYGMDHI